jgi:hypothetical protein
MQDAVRGNRLRSAPSIIPGDDVPGLSDDECVARLAREIEVRDETHLDAVARLIARLAVAIE